MNKTFLLALLLFAVTSSTSFAETLDEAATRAAKEKGYTGEKARCYAEVSKQYFSQGRGGQWGVQTGGAERAWRGQLLSKCGISR